MVEVSYSKQSLRALRRMPANAAALIRAKVLQYAADPTSLANNVKMLKGLEGVLRLRVGDWRVIFREDGTIIAVIRIAPRGDVYD